MFYTTSTSFLFSPHSRGRKQKLIEARHFEKQKLLISTSKSRCGNKSFEPNITTLPSPADKLKKRLKLVGKWEAKQKLLFLLISLKRYQKQHLKQMNPSTSTPETELFLENLQA
ncbi:CLUMA_CG020102, isoform A [Clunio marinus]|uniref:CLUMA_CG020102, isoform A n=1 Tax=Clunio marinus TaxID=568069 RepID=A0A1J1J872_9DIPT|nr:CLUMA_CG020102, isoform A [Clunio marinus]